VLALHNLVAVYRHLPAEVARAKLRAMVTGTAQVRQELGLRPPA
jgi:hypothetical protein